MTTKLRWHAFTVLLVAAISVGGLAYWLWNARALPNFVEGSKYEVHAVVPSAEALAPRASVRIAGLPVGEVKELNQHGRNAVLRLQIDDSDHYPLPNDTRLSIRLRTIIGENYVELYPGSAGQTVPDGGTLPMSQVNEYVNVDEILSVLRGETREHAKRFIRGLGQGVRNRGPELNRFVEGAAGTLEEGSAVNRILARDRQQVSRLVENFGDVTRAIGERGEALQQMTRGMRVSFESIARRDQALRAMLEEMPSTLRQVRDTADIVRSVTGDAAPVLANLGGAVRELKPSIELLRPAAREGRLVLDEVGRSARPVRSALTRVSRLSGPAARALPRLRRVMCELNPAANYLAPYGGDLGSFFGSFGSAGNYYDAKGHALRISLVGTHTAWTAWDQETAEAVETLMQSGLLEPTGAYHGYNPIPAPGGAADLETGRGVAGPADWPYEYPRVEAEC